MAAGAGKVVGHFRRLAAVAATIGLSGCWFQGTEPQACCGDPPSANTCCGQPIADAAGGDVAPCSVQPHLKSLEIAYFANSCALSHCHDKADPAQGNLDLSSGHARAALLNVLAFQAKAKKAGKLLVVPGHPEQSFLYEKLMQTSDGVLMPYGATSTYDAACSVAAVRAWIEGGALDD